MKRFILFLLLAVTLLIVTPLSDSVVTAAPGAQQSDGYPIANGYFFTATAPEGYGFAVVNDENAAFWTEFQRLGGLQNVGYPISQRFRHDGFTVQAFQKLVLQWRPEVMQAWPMNVFDEYSYDGYDDQLYRVRQTPYHFGAPEPAGTPWHLVVESRLELLDANPAIRDRYFSLSEPITNFGLPTSKVEDMGNHYAIRTQRAVFQQWKEQVPWADAGQVTIANGGDIGKELGWLGAIAGDALQPEPEPNATSVPVFDLSVGGGTPQRLYATVPKLDNYSKALMLSTDGGQSWSKLADMDETVLDTTVVPGTPDRIVAIGAASGIYEFEDGSWKKRSDRTGYAIALSSANKNHLWIAHPHDPTGPAGVDYSSDGGATWSRLPNYNTQIVSSMSLLVDPRDNASLFSTHGNHHGDGYLHRYLPANGAWEGLGSPPDFYYGFLRLAFDSRSGALYGSGRTGGLYKSDNPFDLPEAIEWSPRPTESDFTHTTILGLSHQGESLILYANRSDDYYGWGALHRSLDDGETWQRLTQPTLQE
ncbi:MAG: hypothetical protein H6638_09750 [Ardenticatenales bacterium]|nr:hypothetical protein [Ardenticatenales bacterium]